LPIGTNSERAAEDGAPRVVGVEADFCEVDAFVVEPPPQAATRVRQSTPRLSATTGTRKFLRWFSEMLTQYSLQVFGSVVRERNENPQRRGVSTALAPPRKLPSVPMAIPPPNPFIRVPARPSARASGAGAVA
jgi:hypothetical protein